jgi:hypothetical protein
LERGANISQVPQRQRTIAPAGAPPPRGRAEGFTWADYRDLIIAAHCQLLGTPAPGLVLGYPQRPPGAGTADFAAENKEWLRIYRLPAYAPDHVHSEFNLVTAPNRIFCAPAFANVHHFSRHSYSAFGSLTFWSANRAT